MRELWIKVHPALPKLEKEALIQKTAEICTAHLTEVEDALLARKSGSKNIVCSTEDGDIVLLKEIREIPKFKKRGKKTSVIVTVKSKGDEKKIVTWAEAGTDYVVAMCPDWKIIPLENLIASIHGKSKLLAFVSNVQEAKIALETLEIGVDGIVADLSDVYEIMKIYKTMQAIKTRRPELESSETIRLLPAKVTEIKPINAGARVCIDTCDIMREGEGILVGCQSSGLFLIEAEVHETPFVAPRPFRVNAGSIALYVLAPSGKTRYLSELKAGDEVLIVDRYGKNRTTNICRVKIEWRPLTLIEAECEGKKFKTIVQNAETIRIVTENGSKSMKDLTAGDKVLLHLKEGGRHFGTLVKEEKVIER
ncbi:MAG: 3-dehydroquinate synthase II [Candidatus Bathyarchaeia archaeon]